MRLTAEGTLHRKCDLASVPGPVRRGGSANGPNSCEHSLGSVLEENTTLAGTRGLTGESGRPQRGISVSHTHTHICTPQPPRKAAASVLEQRSLPPSFSLSLLLSVALALSLSLSLSLSQIGSAHVS